VRSGFAHNIVTTLSAHWRDETPCVVAFSMNRLAAPFADYLILEDLVFPQVYFRFIFGRPKTVAAAIGLKYDCHGATRNVADGSTVSGGKLRYL
jgi:hypothetical protein